MENRLQGTWRLKTAERNSFLNWRSFSTGYENGRFQFQDNGTALYTDNLVAMNGDWRMRQVNPNNDDENQRFALFIHLIDFNQQKTLSLDFDEIDYRGRNRFFGEYQSSGYRYRYEFVRD